MPSEPWLKTFVSIVSLRHQRVVVLMAVKDSDCDCHADPRAGDLYLRPPHVLVATAVSVCEEEGPHAAVGTWRRADWLNSLSIANKQDFARLHGFRFMLTSVKVTRPSTLLPSTPCMYCGSSPYPLHMSRVAYHVQRLRDITEAQPMTTSVDCPANARRAAGRRSA